MAVHLSGACTRLVRAVAAAFVLTIVPLIGGTLTVAQAQQRTTIEFRTALEPYGRWQQHRRWGEVWLPARVSEDWRPYKLGRWAYTEDWGWYWASDEDFGWITYHYGRWVFDPDLGWVWIPGREWGPAFVQWRRSATYVGWAPLPPDDIIVEYRDEPDVWLFVRTRDFVAPRIWTVMLPPRQVAVYLRETVVVNQTVLVNERGARLAVNPGIEPAIVAAAARRPVTTFAVQPRVLAGTSGVQGAVTVRADEMRAQRRDRMGLRESQFLRQTQNTIRPIDKVPEAKPLAANEKGRLGDTPPRAAMGARDATPQTQGRDAAPAKESARDAERRAREDARAGRDRQQRPQTEGRGTEEPKAQQRMGRDREQLKPDRRDAREQLQQERRGAREEMLRERRDAQERLQRDRRDAQERVREQRRDAQERVQERRRDAQERMREPRESLRGRDRPAATEGRSAPDEGRRFERGPAARPEPPRASPMERGPRPDAGRPAPQVERAALPRVEAPRGPSGPPATTGAAPREAAPAARGPGGPGGPRGGGPGGGPQGRPDKPGGPPGN